MVVPTVKETGFDWFKIEEYDGLDESVELLKNEIKAHGPFDGILGFSQGGVVASLLAAVTESGEFPSIKFAIFMASFPASATIWKAKYPENGCSVPSLHFWGTKDNLVSNDLSEELSKLFISPEVHVHDSSHVVPNKGVDKVALRKFLEAHK
eukprot:TRINITY_DN2535_c0_g1_i3.p1 TRINITY_DN2535_c0_g1~~TRINITY_DN2535_c0_g1_i3.p1  ORF type:complete len:152 (-),score=35.77 TRINITY_DN2535_c0_g1_i3:267-722(-)